jgi:hypothetical protein
MFVMHKNTLGNFDKINTRYPYYYSASQPQQTIGSSTSWRQWGMGTFNTGNAVNSSAGDMFKPSNGWKAPVDGIYSIKSRYRWQDGTSNTGARGARVDINYGYWTGVWDTEVLQTRNPGYAVATDIAMITPCRAGDTLVFWSYQDTGQNLLMNSFVSIAMIHALPYYPVP